MVLTIHGFKNVENLRTNPKAGLKVSGILEETFINICTTIYSSVGKIKFRSK
jgi:hypothetical protein